MLQQFAYHEVERALVSPAAAEHVIEAMRRLISEHAAQIVHKARADAMVDYLAKRRAPLPTTERSL